MSLCSARPFFKIKLSAGVEQRLCRLVSSAPCACALGGVLKDGRRREDVFITAPDSSVYCSQHPSRGTNRQSWTQKILREHKKFTATACACPSLLGGLELIVTEPHPSVVCSHVCMCRATSHKRGRIKRGLLPAGCRF